MQIEDFATAIVNAYHKAAPREELWDIKDIAGYLKLSIDHTRKRVVANPSFPGKIALPSAGNGRKGKHDLWVAVKVKNWVLQHEESR